ncbi:general vesicular transport factor p115 isoform X1 [Dermacentor variabilis]|uniref:general vesicular transport factor p115 isoform X1 n=1 Tax=Dermacentor variabilis TaxID=34621 RepID=UPI003F5C582E
MELFKSGLKTVLGGQPGAHAPTGAETVERLVNRVQTSTLLEDRRDACRALKALAKKFRVEVGAQGMDALVHILETDRGDGEIIGYALDALSYVISGAEENEEDSQDENASRELGEQFTEIYIKKPENVTLLLDLMEEFDFRVRWPSVRLLTGLLVHRAKEVQECVLTSPMGVSRLMDLLSDSREVIRNDALLLLSHLTKANANIQKIVAFENAFDRLLDIIIDEGCSDGGVVVEDCLVVLLHLLKNNNSNQNFFKEGSYIQRLSPFFNYHHSQQQQQEGSEAQQSGGGGGWSAQKVSNIFHMLQVVRSLVSPSAPLNVTSSCQKAMNQSGLLEQLCNILMAIGVPADILTETINTVAEVIRGHHSNQEYFASVNAPSNPPRPAIVVLLMSMVNEKQPFVLRCAVLYCFQCFLYKNELGQAQIIQTLLPTCADMTSVTAGQLLCGGLFSTDPLSNWFAAVALSHALVDNPTQKEQLLRVQLATSVGNPPVSLMRQCTAILQQGGKLQTRLGLLMLMSTWLANCTLAVTSFLNIPTNIPYLTSQVGLAEGDEHEDLVQGLCAFLLGICIEFNDDSVPSFTSESLCQLLMKRVGLDTFVDKLVAIPKQECYSQAAQKPQLKYKHPSEVFFDYEFCRLFKSLEGTIIKAVQPRPKDLQNGPESNMTAQQHSLLLQYKTVIRDQDERIKSMTSELETLRREHQESTRELKEMVETVQQLKDQNALLKAQRASFTVAAGGGQGDSKSPSPELDQTKRELEDLRKQHEQILQELETLKAQKVSQAFVTEPAHTPSSETVADPSLKAELDSAKERIAALEAEVSSLREASELLKKEKESSEEELQTLRKEQEDLLVMLTEQDTKIFKLKSKFKELGVEAEPDAVPDLGESDDDLGSDLGDTEDLVVVGEPNEEV